MLAGFEGFVDTGINRDADNISNNELNNQPVIKTSKLGSLNRKVVRTKRKHEVFRKISAKESKLPTPKEEEEYEEEKEDTNVAETKKSPEREYKEVNLTDVPCVLTSQSLIHPPLTIKPDNDNIKHSPIDFGPSSLEALNKFEETQKKLEAFNSQRKEQLKQALSDRAKKTKEEVKRLNAIEEELKKLDTSVSNDVCILRNQIEIASQDFMEAQKRFNKAEKEYVEAKTELFTKREKKELLTSHLCSIIEQNELRKAKKLSDLMEKLEVPSKSMPIVITTKSEITEHKEPEINEDTNRS